jgi:hypothetical protein
LRRAIVRSGCASLSSGRNMPLSRRKSSRSSSSSIACFNARLSMSTFSSQSVPEPSLSRIFQLIESRVTVCDVLR